MFDYYLGCDNGVSGSIGIIASDGSFIEFVRTPVFEQQDYTKAKKNINRIDRKALKEIIIRNVGSLDIKGMAVAFIEKPMVNPMRFDATISGVRAYEATLGVLEDFDIPVHTIESKEWQKVMLPKGTWKQITKEMKNKDGSPKLNKAGKPIIKVSMKAESADLKKASRDIALRLFPSARIGLKEDGDGILLAEFGRRFQLGISR